MKNIVWFNGDFLEEDAVLITPSDRGFLYGEGCFETLRADDSHIHHLEEHIERLHAGLATLSIAIPVIHWQTVIRRLLELNGLTKPTARIRIVATRGRDNASTLLANAEPYSPPIETEYREGWSLHVSDVFTPFHAEIKSVSYLSYLLARRQCPPDFNDAILFDRDGNIAETSTASLLIFSNEHWLNPDTRFQLHGIARRMAIEIMRELNLAVKPTRISQELLQQAEAVWALNSLIGVMPVRQIGEYRLPRLHEELARSIRERLFLH